MAVHNEILRRRPDLAPVMAAPWYMDRKGEVPEGKQPYFQIPIFNYFKVSAAPLLKLCCGCKPLSCQPVRAAAVCLSVHCLSTT